MAGILSLLKGRRLCDRYHVHAVIGTGGMGAVCRATDERLGRDVAIKVLTLTPTDADELDVLRARFHREARAAAALRHPNVVTVHDFGTDPALGLDFLVMEFLPGEDVAQRLAREGGPLEVHEALEIVREAAMGLAAGHRAGLVHRDVKPRNIFLVSDPAGGWEVKVLDFGIAQVSSLGAETLVQLTRALAPHTPRYAAPEQVSGAPITAACDVYALGLTALEMLTGRYPEGVNAAPDDGLASRWAADLNASRPDLPSAVAAVLLKALLRDPARRFADANRLLTALDRAMSKSGHTVQPPGFAAAAPSDATVFMPAGRASPADEAGTRVRSATPPRPRFSIPVPPPVVAGAEGRAPDAPAPQGAGAPPTEEQGGEEAKPRRRFPYGVVLVLLLVAILTYASVQAAREATADKDRVETPADVADAVAGDTDPMRMWILASEEARRVGETLGSVTPRDTLWAVVAASLTEAQVGKAIQIRDELRAKDLPVGMGNSRVYPELRDGWVVVLAGPFRDRGEAGAMRERVRQSYADAFLKRVTFRKPPP